LPLVDKLRQLINLSHALAWENAGHSPSTYKTPDEPGLVAAFLDPVIQVALEKLLQAAIGRKANLQVDSIFTHKTPLVRPTGMSPVEIGDLLLVRQHFVTGSQSVQGRALLLQAKKNAKPNSGDISNGKPNIQFELYRIWPTFSGETRLSERPDLNRPDLWDFKKTNPNGRFGQYLAVFDGQAHGLTLPATLGPPTAAFAASGYPKHPLPKTTWSNGIVSPTALPTEVDCPIDFAEVLESFFHGSVGESFVPGVLSGHDHWSMFVNTMLDEATNADYTFLSKRTNITANTPRGAQIRTLFASLPLVKLAIMREVRRYVPKIDAWGIPRFDNEPHFYFRSVENSAFINDIRQMSEGILENLNSVDWDGQPPDDVYRSDRDDGGGHVPILSIATSGPEPLLQD